MPSNIRQPIVSVLGHVDHGKTSILDFIRTSSVMSREAGAITQHIGATEVPLEVIYTVCSGMAQPGSFRIPGLLFIDTPGHHSFTSLRSRGGALADIAVLVIDIREGFKPQTMESIHILRRLKTPFIVAANKIDLVPGWKSRKMPFAMNLKKQSQDAQMDLDNRLYDLVGQLHEQGYPAERYDRITDYTRNLAIIPVSAKTGEGIADLLMFMVGMAQKFLGKRLEVCGRDVVVSSAGKRDVEKDMQELAGQDLMEDEAAECVIDDSDDSQETPDGPELSEESVTESAAPSETAGDPYGLDTVSDALAEGVCAAPDGSTEEPEDEAESPQDESDDEAVEGSGSDAEKGAEPDDDEDIIYEDEPAHATVLEVKHVKGLGTTLDTIVYRGTMRYNDTIVVGGIEPIVTKVKALLKPKPLDEIRDPRQKFDKVKSVSAASGIKIAAQGLDGVISGAPIRVVASDDPDELDEVIEAIRRESTPNVNLDMEGIVIKADAIGSLEALASELAGGDTQKDAMKNAQDATFGKERSSRDDRAAKEKRKAREGVSIKVARIGDISRRDIIEAATMPEVMHRVILAFNVNILPDAREELESSEVKIITGDIIYKILDDYEDWVKQRRADIEADSRMQLVYPGKMQVLGDHIFHISKPAVFGVRVLSGRIKPGIRFLRRDGNVVGVLRSIRSGNDTIKEAKAGDEVALAVEGVTIGRQIKADFILYTHIPENHAQELQRIKLNHDEKEILQEIIQINRKENKFWGMPR